MHLNRLRLLREAAGLSQADLAKRLEFTQQAIALWEAGKREPNLSTIIRLADIFQVSTDMLLDRQTGEGR